MATVVILPRTDPGLLAFSLNFSTKISLAPTDYGLTTSDATAMSAAQADFAAKLAACDPASRSKTLTAEKNISREALRTQILLLALKIQSDPGVNDSQKIDLGLSVPTPRQQWPIPADAPAVDVIAVVGHTVSIRLHDATDSNRRGMPPFVDGASIFSFVGAEAPSDPAAWFLQGSTSRARFDVVFSNTVPAGATVWLTAFWFNNRKQSGPACSPISTIIAAPNILTA